MGPSSPPELIRVLCALWLVAARAEKERMETDLLWTASCMSACRCGGPSRASRAGWIDEENNKDREEGLVGRAE